MVGLPSVDTRQRVRIDRLLSITDTLFSILHTEKPINSFVFFFGLVGLHLVRLPLRRALAFFGKSVPGLRFFWLSASWPRPDYSGAGAAKHMSIAIYGLTLKLGRNPFIWRQYRDVLIK